MKISVSLPDEDVGFVDEFVAHSGMTSRSAAIHHAISLLRNAKLENAYAAAWDDWEADGEAWDITMADGIADAAR